VSRVLWRTFVAQFFASESATSDVQLRRSMIGILAALLPPGLFLMVEVFPLYELTARFHPDRLEPLLARLGLIFVMYSMAIVGLITVLAWDSLSFDRRDAMVLGPLPLGGRRIVAAKLAALGTLLLATACLVNLMSALPFAFVTANRLGGVSVVRYFGAHLAATLGAAFFTFTTIVTVRGVVSLAGPERAAARVGSLLQFAFVGTILSFVVLVPVIIKGAQLPFVDTAGSWVPAAWFLGLFEYLRGSTREEFRDLAIRGVGATALMIAASVLISIAGLQWQLRFALAPPRPAGPGGGARVSRLIARVVAGRDRAARAIAEFIVLTLARNRAQQAPVAMTAAIGFAIVVAALGDDAGDLAAVLRPRTAVLWIPFMAAYWLPIGVRASAFIPADLHAAWGVRLNAPDRPDASRRALVAAMLGVVVPPVVALAALLVPAVGWRAACWAGVLSVAVAFLTIEIASLTVPHIPYTRPYVPGHARLRTRWPVYLLGVYLSVYWPAHLVMLWGTTPTASPLVTLLVGILICAAAADLVGRHAHRSDEPAEEELTDDFATVTTLSIGSAARGMPRLDS